MENYPYIIADTLIIYLEHWFFGDSDIEKKIAHQMAEVSKYICRRFYAQLHSYAKH